MIGQQLQRNDVDDSLQVLVNLGHLDEGKQYGVRVWGLGRVQAEQDGGQPPTTQESEEFDCLPNFTSATGLT